VLKERILQQVEKSLRWRVWKSKYCWQTSIYI